VTEVLHFYRDHGSDMTVCFLDASKAFDHVDYSILFRKLINRNVFTVTAAVLVYTPIWSCFVGRCFFLMFLISIMVSDTQVGVLSPFLFAVYIDDLTSNLQMANVGCYIEHHLLNHLLFADEAVIFAPSAKYMIDKMRKCAHNLLQRHML